MNRSMSTLLYSKYINDCICDHSFGFLIYCSCFFKTSQHLGNMEFGRRVAIEKDIERNEANYFNNLVFDESGMFLLYGSLLGVKCKYMIVYL